MDGYYSTFSKKKEKKKLAIFFGNDAEQADCPFKKEISDML